jgi:membrane protease subunit (stomatin/prohibitin family)
VLAEMVKINNYRLIQKENGNVTKTVSSNEIQQNDRFATVLMENMNCSIEQQQNRLLFVSLLPLSEEVRKRLEETLKQMDENLTRERGIEEETIKTR